jgi:hypothetical protein
MRNMRNQGTDSPSTKSKDITALQNPERRNMKDPNEMQLTASNMKAIASIMLSARAATGIRTVKSAMPATISERPTTLLINDAFLLVI